MTVETVYYTRVGVPYPLKQVTQKDSEGTILMRSGLYPWYDDSDPNDVEITQLQYETDVDAYVAAYYASLDASRVASDAARVAREADAVLLRAELQGLGITPSLLYLIS